MAKKFLTDINIAGGVYDSSGDIGNSGQVLSSTGSGVNWINATSSASIVYQDGFTGDGSTTAFTLANSIDNENKTQVYIDGVYQHKDNYSLSGTTLTFSTAPPNTADIEVISFSSVSAADDILYDDDFASAGLMTTNGSGVYSITTNNSANWNTAYTYSQVGHLPLSGGAITGAITTNSTFDGRDISVDGTKLDGIEANADVTDTANVTAAGALMDSEVTNLADVKAFDTTDYATAAQGVKADSAQQPPSEGAFVNGDKTKLDGIAAGAEVNVQSDWNSTSGDSLILNKPSIPSITGLASETYVDTAVSNLVDSAPGTLDTLNELAAALGDDANFSTTVTNSIATKLPLAGGTLTGALIGTSFNDGYITWSAAQLNRYGAAIELQYTPTNTATLVKIGANGSNPTIFNAYTGDASFAGTITASGYNDSNWNTAYTYSQVGHLPLAGGTMTGDITISSTSPELKFVDTNSFTDTNDRWIVRGGADTLIMRWYDNSASSNTDALTLSSTAATFTGSIVAGTNPDTTPDGTAFSHTFTSVGGNNRVVNFEGTSSMISTWYSVGNVPYSAIDNSLTTQSFWRNAGSGWQKQMDIYRGYVESIYSFRAPIFYDSNNTSYYVDPTANSVLTTATFNLNANSTISLVAAGTNASQIKAGAGDELYLGGNDTWQMRLSGGNILMDNGGYALSNGSMRAPIFYDSSNTAYYAYPTSQSVFYRLKLQGTGTANAATLEIDNPSTSAFMHTGELFTPNMTAGQTNIFVIGKEGTTKQSGYIGYNWAASGSNNNYVSIGHWSADHLFRVYGDQVLSTVTLRSDVDMRAPVFYDKNNTAYYAHLDSTATSVKIAGGIQSNAANGNVIIKHTVSEANSWLFQENATNWGLFWMNEPISGTVFGSYTTIGAEFIGFRNGSNTNFINPSSYAGIDTNAYAGWLLSNYNGYFWTAGTQYSAVDMRAPIFYDSNNTAFYYNPASGSVQQYTYNVSGATGNYGPQIIVGQTSIALPYTLQDSNVRPVLAATGAYPVLHLNHTTTSNANHGPTIQFTYNGLSGRQWMLGGGGTGEDMQIGYSDTSLGNSTYNPHNGISGYTGVTYMMCKNNGRIGLGAAGDWGAYGGGYPSYAIDTRGTLYNNTDVRAPIFYDSNDTAYYVNPATSSLLKGVQINTTVSSPGASLKIYSTTNHQYPQIHSNASLEAMWNYKNTSAEWYVGIRTSSQLVGASGFHFYNTTSSQTVGGWDINGHSYSIASSRAPIFYDQNNTGYYTDPASTSVLNALQFNYTQHGSANNIRMGNSTTMNAISSGTNNAAFGVEALGGCSTGSRNFAYGYAALYSLSSGGSNIAMGDATGYNVTSGSNNLLFGQNAGRTGYQSPYQSIAGITSGSNQIHMGNESHTTARIQISWTVNSDARDKTDVNPLDLGLEFVKQLNPVTYRWDKRSDYEDRTPDGTNKLPELTLGFLAQEVEVIEKSFGYDVADKTNLVVDRIVDQDHYGITYEKMVPILTKAIQELEARVKELENN